MNYLLRPRIRPVLPGVLECRALRRTVQVRLRLHTLPFPGGKYIFTVSRQQFMKHPGLGVSRFFLDYFSHSHLKEAMDNTLKEQPVWIMSGR